LLTRLSIWLALVVYGLAGVLMFSDRRDRVARLAWTLAWLLFLIHVALAFHHFHHWSHTEAVRHVEQRSGFGPGIFFSYAFTLLWSLDVVWWWLASGSHARRPAWVGLVLHGYMVFIIFNGTVVYETGLVRLGGIVLFATLTVCWLLRRQTLRQGERS
jgi:hypothetical protein